MEIRPLHPLLGAEVIGLDLARPPESMPAAELRAAIGRYGVVVFRNPEPPTDEQHIAFSRLFGPVEVGATFKVAGETRRRITNPALVDVGNLDPDGEIMKPDARRMLFRKGDRLWHADMSFMDNRATFSLLLGHEIPPEGGETEFCDMRVGYDRLPLPLQALADQLTLSHSIWHSRQLAGFPQPTAEEVASRPPAEHPMVHVHAASGRKSLYLASHASHVVGWPERLGRDVIDAVTRAVTEPDLVYRHSWRLGDLLMWDNLAVMHRATEFEDTTYRRDMRRTTCRERPVPVPADA